MQTLGLGILVHNELPGLQKCINSVKEQIDKIIVGVDSRTTDATVKWLIQSNIEYFLFDINDNLSEHYNTLMSRFDTDWVLILDADELIHKSTSHKLLEAIKANTYNDVDCICFKRNNWKDNAMRSLNLSDPYTYIFRLIKRNAKIEFVGRHNAVPSNLKKIVYSDAVQIEHLYMCKTPDVMHTRRIFSQQMHTKECCDSLNIIKEQIYNKNMIKANLS